MKASILIFALISSLVWSVVGHATEDFIFSERDTLHIRTLAASCAVCHGTLGNAVGENKPMETVSLAGQDPNLIVGRLMDYRAGKRTSTVMHHHAKGLTVDEINLLAQHFAQQKVVKRYPPQSQVLKEGSR
ncbi:MAG: class I cytochrome c [Betaproteobacteria bacterium]|nr:class I cytochrome c [Betaproteobacteria bacterium]